MLDVHIARGARADGGRHRGARSGTRAASACSRWTRTRASSASARSRRRRRPRPGARAPASASMGVYIFDIDVLVRELQRDAERDSTHDFGRDIIPRLVAAGERVFAYLFWDENKKESQYWRDVGTLDAYYEASMDLVQVDPVFNLYDPDWPLRTYQPQLPPAKFVFAEDGRRGRRHRVDRVHGLHRLRQRGAPLDPVPRRPRPLVLRRGGLDPAARRGGAAATPASGAPSSTAAWRCRGAPSSATTPPRTADATPSPRAEWSSSPPARSASCDPVATA